MTHLVQISVKALFLLAATVALLLRITIPKLVGPYGWAAIFNRHPRGKKIDQQISLNPQVRQPRISELLQSLPYTVTAVHKKAIGS